MLSFQTVQPDTLELLKALMQLPTLKDMRLVGGTALALQYGHRRSVVSMSCFADAAPQAVTIPFKTSPPLQSQFGTILFRMMPHWLLPVVCSYLPLSSSATL